MSTLENLAALFPPKDPPENAEPEAVEILSDTATSDAPTEPRFLESSDVAKLLGVSAGSVKSLAARGILTPSARTVRGCGLYRPSDVVAFIQARRARRGR